MQTQIFKYTNKHLMGDVVSASYTSKQLYAAKRRQLNSFILLRGDNSVYLYCQEEAIQQLYVVKRRQLSSFMLSRWDNSAALCCQDETTQQSSFMLLRMKQLSSFFKLSRGDNSEALCCQEETTQQLYAAMRRQVSSFFFCQVQTTLQFCNSTQSENSIHYITKPFRKKEQ